jgi:hypothetical protein
MLDGTTDRDHSDCYCDQDEGKDQAVFGGRLASVARYSQHASVFLTFWIGPALCLWSGPICNEPLT